MVLQFQSWRLFSFLDRYRAPIKDSCILHLVGLLFSAIMLDGGVLSKFVILCATAYWFGVLLIMLRRDGRATRSDRLWLRWGFLFAIGLVLGVGRVVMRLHA